MLGAVRGSVLALLCAAAMGGGLSSAFAAETLDTSKLPRLPNGKQVFASEFQTIFTSTDSVAQAGETLTRSLAAQGWQPYIQPFASNPTYPNMQTLSFKKGTLALSVYISLAPAMGNATSIQYATIPLANDLPFPKDATDIAFDPSRPHLNFISGMPPQDALEFFRKELTAQGWSPWSTKDEARTDSAGTVHSQGQGGVAYYVRDGKNPMLLSLTTIDGKLKGELKAIPMSVLQAVSRKDKEPPKVAAVPVPVTTEMPRNPLADEIERKAMSEVRDQLAGIRKEIEVAVSMKPGATRQATVRATGSGPVTDTAKTEPLKREPQTTIASAPPIVIYKELESEDVAGLPAPKSSSSKGSERTPFRVVMNAQVAADVQSVLAFYRRELGKRGWKEEESKTKTKPGELAFAYSSPDGPAVLKLSRKDDDTIITLSLRKPAEAQKAGVLPKPGQSKLLFGNVMPTEASITINKQTVKVGAGVGSTAPNGPTLDLPPGKYKFSFRIGNTPAQTDEVEIAADETWGILIGPGGALALPAY